jgi:hypothetical protein
VNWLEAIDSVMLLRLESRYDVLGPILWMSSSGNAQACPFVGSAALAIVLVAGPVIAGAVLMTFGSGSKLRSGFRSALGWYPLDIR